MTAKLTAAADGLSGSLAVGANEAFQFKPTGGGLELSQDGITFQTVDTNGKVAFPQNQIAFTGYQAGPTGAGFTPTVLTDIVASTNIGDAWNPTGDRFQPDVEGWYQFNMRVTGITSVAANYFGATINKNTGGVNNQLQHYVAPYLNLYGQPAVSGIFYLNGTTDYVQFLVDAGGGAGTLNWSDVYVSAALLVAG